jgi:hypothetical protein
MNFKRLLTNCFVIKRNLSAESQIGYALSYMMNREFIESEGLLKRWDVWEAEYARRGFRTISLERFVQLGGYNQPVNDVLGLKRNSDEDTILHALIYRYWFIYKPTPTITFEIDYKSGLSLVQHILRSTE